jgi:hypothetical protein
MVELGDTSLNDSTKKKLTEAKIKKLVSFEHEEELFHILAILDDKELSSFMQHYKNAEMPQTTDKKLDQIIRAAESPKELIMKVKAYLAELAEDEYKKVKDTISARRKKGFDVFIEWLRISSIPQKIKLFKATSLKRDYLKIRNTLTEISNALEEQAARNRQKN